VVESILSRNRDSDELCLEQHCHWPAFVIHHICLCFHGILFESQRLSSVAHHIHPCLQARMSGEIRKTDRQKGSQTDRQIDRQH